MVISLPFLLTQLVSFGILAFLLYRFLYKPLSKMMRERSAKIKEGLEAAERARAEAVDASAQIEADILAARKEAANIVSEARESAQRITDQELANTRHQIQENLTKARAEIEHEKATVMEELKQEIGALVILATEKVVRNNVSDKKQSNALVKAMLEDAVKQREISN